MNATAFDVAVECVVSFVCVNCVREEMVVAVLLLNNFGVSI